MVITGSRLRNLVELAKQHITVTFIVYSGGNWLGSEVFTHGQTKTFTHLEQYLIITSRFPQYFKPNTSAPPFLIFFRGVNPRSGVVMGDYGYIDEDDEEDEEEDEEERSLDLLIRFIENIFRKVSRKEGKAVRSILPVPISTQLVEFAVNGIIILTFLCVLKAFLQVICTLGSAVFVSILLIRGIWTGISYFQESHIHRADDDDPHAWTGTKPAI